MVLVVLGWANSYAVPGGRGRSQLAAADLLIRRRDDLRLEGGPEEPTTYGDVVVSQARADSWVPEGALADGAAARSAARRKQRRYPPEQVPGAQLVAFSVEAGGRWDDGVLHFLKRAADRAAERHPGLAAMGAQGAAVVYNSWLAQLSCTLQKANVACLRSASAGGRGPAAGDHFGGCLARPRARRVSLRSLVVRSLTSHLTREGLRNPRAPRQNEAHVSAIRGHGTGRRPRGSCGALVANGAGVALAHGAHPAHRRRCCL